MSVNNTMNQQLLNLMKHNVAALHSLSGLMHARGFWTADQDTTSSNRLPDRTGGCMTTNANYWTPSLKWTSLKEVTSRNFSTRCLERKG